jgi:fumarylacetoacetate (FAA) hydrolase family protein
VRKAQVGLTVTGDDGYRLEGSSAMSRISRDPADLVSAMIGRNHQYPDGAALYLGTMFAPIDDRGEIGQGFTHRIGDIVTIASPKLGRLSNRVVLTSDAEPWTYGTAALMKNLARRGLI